MVKGSGHLSRCARAFFIWVKYTERRLKMEKGINKSQKAIIAYRKKCKVNGTGLSHYILMNKKGK